jgi:hypothetical protein
MAMVIKLRAKKKLLKNPETTECSAQFPIFKNSSLYMYNRLTVHHFRSANARKTGLL